MSELLVPCAALATALASMSLGGALYEFTVVDPFWPRRPDIIQPARGGISRKRFWIPAHRGLVSSSRPLVVAHRSRQPCGDEDMVSARPHSQGVGLRVHGSCRNSGNGGSRLDTPQPSAAATGSANLQRDARELRGCMPPRVGMSNGGLGRRRSRSCQPGQAIVLAARQPAAADCDARRR